AKGTVTKPGNLDCEPTGGDGDWVTLQAFKSTPKSNVNFFADKRTDVPNARPAFMASAYNAHGKIDIGRSVFMRGKPAQFTYTLPDQAQVKPKGLFSGQATLSGESWTGNLKVKLPGKRVALA